MQRARFIPMSGFISNDFIAALACRKLGITLDQLEAIVGRNSKGKHKGQLKGRLEWEKCIEGGWSWDITRDDTTATMKISNGGNQGYIIKPNTTRRYKLTETWTGKVLLER